MHVKSTSESTTQRIEYTIYGVGSTIWDESPQAYCLSTERDYREGIQIKYWYGLILHLQLS